MHSSTLVIFGTTEDQDDNVTTGGMEDGMVVIISLHAYHEIL
jgi:hypothetical protein